MRHFFQAIFFAVSIVLVLLARAATAETDLEAGERLYEEGRAAETRLDFARAALDYDSSLRVAPSGRWALAARARSDDLHAHSEGAFGPLTSLERVRRGPQTSDVLDGLMKEAETFPNGPVRSEARMLCAEGYLSSLVDRRREDGTRALGLVLDDPSADPTIKHFAARRLADMALQEGRIADARSAAARAGDPSLERRVTQIVRRRIAHRASLGAIGAMLFFGIAAIVRRRSVRIAHARTIGAFAVVIALGGAIASAYEQGNAVPFVALAGAIAVLAMLASAWASAGSPKTWARVGRAIVCGAAIAGAGFLVLEKIDTRYLEGFGL